jgi:gamma-carbonic anhydrase
MLLPHRGRHPQISPTAFIAQSAQIIGEVSIGAESSVWFNVVIRGDVHYIRIGERTNVQDGTVIHVSRNTHPTVIGDEVTIGHNVTLHGCTIGNRCLIGMGSVILDGALIGDESLIAAGAVVAPGTEIPPRTLAIGSPARPHRLLTAEEIQHLRQSAENYIGYVKDYLPDV